MYEKTSRIRLRERAHTKIYMYRPYSSNGVLKCLTRLVFTLGIEFWTLRAVLEF
jgi:hypothetical protein